MIERPIRDWEIVTEVISVWDTGDAGKIKDDKSLNSIILKRFGFRETLTPMVCISYVEMHSFKLFLIVYNGEIPENSRKFVL